MDKFENVVRKNIYEFKNSNSRLSGVDNGENKPFREIEFTDIDTVKKYVSSLYEARLSREVKYIKLLMLKNICIGDVVKRKIHYKTPYFLIFIDFILLILFKLTLTTLSVTL